jgi:hypothetical protein
MYNYITSDCSIAEHKQSLHVEKNHIVHTDLLIHKPDIFPIPNFTPRSFWVIYGVFSECYIKSTFSFNVKGLLNGHLDSP